jgi:hypothetical protein
MTTRSSRDRNLRGGEVAGTPMIVALRASYAVAFTRASQKSQLSSLGAPQTPTGPRSFQARTSAAEGGRLRDAFGAARRRPDRCKIQDQELKTEPLPCLINSAGSSTYPTRKSVRTTRATPFAARNGIIMNQLMKLRQRTQIMFRTFMASRHETSSHHRFVIMFL